MFSSATCDKPQCRALHSEMELCVVVEDVVRGQLSHYQNTRAYLEKNKKDEIGGNISEQVRKDVRHDVVLCYLHDLHQQDHLLLQGVTPGRGCGGVLPRLLQTEYVVHQVFAKGGTIKKGV